MIIHKPVNQIWIARVPKIPSAWDSAVARLGAAAVTRGEVRCLNLIVVQITAPPEANREKKKNNVHIYVWVCGWMMEDHVRFEKLVMTQINDGNII
jgi:hypothetical protein